MASHAEISAMRQAIILSVLGLGTASPNPPVGCVILDADGHVAGTGFHRRKGESHAEVNALSAAGAAARGGTAVVTLEPCNHVGVTPACRQALLDAGIERVVIGVMDPTSRGDGGAAVLTAAGVDVESGVLSAEVLTVLGPWMTSTIGKAPHVTLAYAIGPGTDTQADAALLRTLRAGVDIVVANGLASEGIPGGHSSQHFYLADLQSFDEDCDKWLTLAYKAGVRRALLLGQSNLADSLLAADAVDRLIIAVPRNDDGLDPGRLTAEVPPTFRIVDLGASQGHQLVGLSRKHEV